MASNLDREQKSGLFIVSYNVFKPGLAGGYNLSLQLSVYPPARQISGRATLTQALQQPLVLQVPVRGHYEEKGGDIELFLTGFGSPTPSSTLLIEEFHFDGALKGGWQAEAGSKARYAFLQNGHWHEVIGQEVQLSDELRHSVKALNLR
ncbi:hypothetical protein CEK28_15745 [Xenophilus sp. AP218F]|nr:hypothetical protein CEK28_15745 [Xenophilus sp. AP218F]